MRVQIELNARQAAHLEQLAIIEGFRREEPRKKWTETERKEAIRYAILRATNALQFQE